MAFISVIEKNVEVCHKLRQELQNKENELAAV